MQRRAFICGLSLSSLSGALSCARELPTPARRSKPDAMTLTQAPSLQPFDVMQAPSERVALDALEARLGALAAGARGKIGIAVVHVQSGRKVLAGGKQRLPLQSVFKLPLAIAILKEVEAGHVSLDQVVTVRAEDRAPGVASNESKWARVPREANVRQLLEYSLVDSDNTSSDKLLALLGGPLALTQRMRTLGFSEIAVRAPTKAQSRSGEPPNEATAETLANLLVGLTRGNLLGTPQHGLLWQLLGRARTGERRIRAGLPLGTPVVDKTGTGRNGTVTNDVGVVTLPRDAGHLAIAVLIAASPLPTGAQEDLIAEITRAAFDCFSSRLD